MTVRAKDQGVIELSGVCGVEDGEVLQRHLLAEPGSTVEWSNCASLHSAVIQVLLVGRPRMQGTPKNAFLRIHVAPVVGPGALAAARKRDAQIPRKRKDP